MNLKQKFGVTYEPTIIKKDGTVVKHPAKHNLLMDRGLDQVGVRGVEIFRCCHLGDSAAPTNKMSTVDAITWAGTTVTSTDDYFDSGDAYGKHVIQFPDESTCRIIEFISAREVIVDTEGSLADTSCITWKVSQTTLLNKLKTSTKYNLDVDTNNGTLITEGAEDDAYGTGEYWRTFEFDFTEETTIYEAGYDEGTTYISGRVVFDEPLVIEAGSRLLLKLTLCVHFMKGSFRVMDPIFNTPATLELIDIWKTKGYGHDYVDGDGNDRYESLQDFPLFQPSAGYVTVKLRNLTTTVIDAMFTKDTYVEGSFEHNFYYNHANQIQDPFYIIEYCSYYKVAMRMTLDTTQEIPDDTLLSMQFKVKWDRILPAFPIA